MAPADGTVSIETTGGRVAAQLGDWIIKRAAEDFSLCRPDAFAANYEPALSDAGVWAAPPSAVPAAFDRLGTTTPHLQG